MGRGFGVGTVANASIDNADVPMARSAKAETDHRKREAEEGGVTVHPYAGLWRLVLNG